MDDCIDSVGKAQIFLTLDPNAVYWEVGMDGKDVDKTALVTHHGLYRKTRMPFALKNAQETIQRTMDVVLVSVQWQCKNTIDTKKI